MIRRFVRISMTRCFLAALIVAAALHVGACARPAGATKFTQVTADTTYTESDPAPSPDGKWIAFVSDRSGSRQVWLRPASGGESRQLSHEPDSVRSMTPTWSPDGKSILFISTRTKQYNIYRIPFEGGEAVPMSETEGSNRFATYSPDGSKILFTSNRLKPGELWGFNLYVMDATGEKSREGTAKQITNNVGSPGHPVWSPDGKWIAVQGRVGDKIDVWIYEVATGAFFPLTSFGDASKPTWSSDSKSVWFTRFTGIKESIWIATELNLTPPAPAKKPAAKKPAAKKAASKSSTPTKR